MASFKTFKKIRRKRARRGGRHDHEGVTPTTAPTQQNNDSHQADILNMQETIGNQAVMQMMRQGDIDQPKAKSTSFNPNSFKIQRLPTIDEAQSVIEQPKAESATSQANSSRIQRMPTVDEARSELPDSAGSNIEERKNAILNMIRHFNVIIENYPGNFPQTVDEIRWENQDDSPYKIN